MANGGGGGALGVERRVEVRDDADGPAGRVRRAAVRADRRRPRAACGPRGPRGTGRSRGRSAGSGSALRPPPGRVARSRRDDRLQAGERVDADLGHAAVAWSVSSRLLHHQVLDAGVHEALAVGGVAGAARRAPSAPVWAASAIAASPRARGRGPRSPRAAARRCRGAAPRAGDGDAAELGGVAVHDDACGGDDPAVLDGDEVQRGLVVLVDLFVDGDALLDDEDLVAQRERGADLVRVARRADLGHCRAYLRMSSTRSARWKYGPWWTNVCLPFAS